MPRRKDARRGGAGKSSGATAAVGSGAGSVADPAGLEERVLRDIWRLYKDPAQVDKACGKVGMEAISAELGSSMRHPSKKITVMIVGNHSAGKSSFINWYAGSEVLATAVAVESQGFTIVTNGNRNDTISKDAAVEMKPYLKGIEQFDGALDHLSVVVSTSSHLAFPNVDFVDTPGLIDGGVGYPFDVNAVILWMAQHVDMVLVFMDPHMKALCSRTMDVVSALDNAKYGNKMKFVLTKADQVPDPQDLMKVQTQLVANLGKHFRDHHGLEVLTMWIPNREGSIDTDPKLNALGKVVDHIAYTVKQKVQENMQLARQQSKQLSSDIDEAIADSRIQKATRRRYFCNQLFISLIVCPLLLLVAFADLVLTYSASLPTSITEAPAVANALKSLAPVHVVMTNLSDAVALPTVWHRQGVALVAFLAFVFLKELFAWKSRHLHVRTAAQLTTFLDYKACLGVMLKKANAIHKGYLDATQPAETY